ncbi:MAG: general secretion pathway protein GspK [Omnitrophica bacterium]|nr:general secretion pathway protein GspK [Candidatus Omnitrophota bacterium]
MEQGLSSLLKQLVSRSAVNRRASILIIALWALSLLATFAIILGYNVRQRMSLVTKLNERARLRFITEAGIKKVVIELSKESDIGYSSLSDNWNDNTSAFKDVNVGRGTFSISYTYRDKNSEGLKTRYGLVDEERKININEASQITLKRLFRTSLNFNRVKAQELAAAIVDWRDADSALSIPLGSAEDSYYSNRRYPYEAKDAKFEVLDELLLVRGMSKEIFEKLRGYITIYGDGKVNINTASPEVLFALGLNEEVVNKILSFRYGLDGIEATDDDNIFYDSMRIVSKLSQSFSMSSLQIAQLDVVSDQNLGVDSYHFTAKIKGELINKKAKTEVNCVITREGDILYWQEF